MEKKSNEIADIIPHYEDRFYIKNLSDGLQKDVLALYKGILAFKTTIDLPYGTSEDNAELLINVIQYDCPELFQVDHTGQYTIITTNGMVTSIMLNYTMSKSEYEENLKKCQSIIHTLVSSTKNLSATTKEKHVYDYLTDRVSYNTIRPQCGNAYGALVNKAAKCDGISLAMKWIMEEMDIATIVLTGQEKGDPFGHAWNCVKLNGSYYDVDLTNDLINDDRLMKLYSAYNVKREWITRTYPLSPVLGNNYTLPESKHMQQSFHVLNDSYIYHGEDIRSRFYSLLDGASFSSGEGLIQFESDSDYNTFMLKYENYLDDWFNEIGSGGSFQLSTLSEYRTVGFEVTVD